MAKMSVRDMLTRAFRAKTIDELGALEEQIRAEPPMLGGEHQMEGGEPAQDVHIHVHPPGAGAGAETKPRMDRRPGTMMGMRRGMMRRDRMGMGGMRRGRMGMRRDMGGQHYFTDPGEGEGSPDVNVVHGGGGGEGDMAEIMEMLHALQDEHEQMMDRLDALEDCMDGGSEGEMMDGRYDARMRRGRMGMRMRRDRRRDDDARRDTRSRDMDEEEKDKDMREDSDPRRDRRDDDAMMDRRRDNVKSESGEEMMDRRRDRRDDMLEDKKRDADPRRDDRRRDAEEGAFNASEAGANASNEEILSQIKFEAPPGTNDHAFKARDSMALADLWQDNIAAVEILAPGLRMPAFDAALPPVQTMDCMCDLRRTALREARGRSDTKELVEAIIGGQDPATMPVRAMSDAFRAAATAKRMINNRAAGIGRDSAMVGYGGGGGVIGMAKTPADVNRQNAEFWQRQQFGVPSR